MSFCCCWPRRTSLSTQERAAPLLQAQLTSKPESAQAGQQREETMSQVKQQIQKVDLERFQDNSQILTFFKLNQFTAVCSLLIRKVFITRPFKSERATSLKTNEQILFDFLGKKAQRQVLAVVCQSTQNEAVLIHRLQRYCPAVLQIEVVRPKMPSILKSYCSQRNRELSKMCQLQQQKNNLKSSFMSETTQKQVSEELKLNFMYSLRFQNFDKILVLPRRTDYQSAHGWVKSVLCSRDWTGCKLQIYLPRQVSLKEISEILAKSHTKFSMQKSIQDFLNESHYQLDLLCLDDQVEALLMTKRGNLQKQQTLFAMAQHLILLELNNESSFIYSRVLKKIRKLTLQQYFRISKEVRLTLQELDQASPTQKFLTVFRIIRNQKLITDAESVLYFQSYKQSLVIQDHFCQYEECDISRDIRNNYSIDIGSIVSSPEVNLMQNDADSLIWPSLNSQKL